MAKEQFTEHVDTLCFTCERKSTAAWGLCTVSIAEVVSEVLSRTVHIHYDCGCAGYFPRSLISKDHKECL